MPAVSVIIPTYNCGRFLTESLDSILGQTLPPHEVVVVDDGSTDDTPAVLSRFAGKVRVVLGSHGGLSAARNLGLQHATGTHVAFHDADDVARPDRLQRHVRYLEEHPQFDAVFCNGERMGIDDPQAACVVPKDFGPRIAGRAISALDLFEGFPIYFQGALVPKRAFDATGAFDPTFRVQPDIEYAYRLFAHCTPTYVDTPVFDYRWHTTNNSRDRLGGRADIARILEALPAVAPEAARLVGERRLRVRLARHYFRLGRLRLDRGEGEAARTAFAKAAMLQPLHPRYQWMRLRYAT